MVNTASTFENNNFIQEKTGENWTHQMIVNY